ncbi:MAG: endonuclease/exonuclease/phosphatase family protein [bacterium]|nr:endonuclease/exonuclease/phosphatase family protein [bacterium]
MTTEIRTISIQTIQGDGLQSPQAGHVVRTRGVVTGATRKGFFIQDPEAETTDTASCGLFVFSYEHRPAIGTMVEAEGRIVDFIRDEGDRPTTELGLQVLRELGRGPAIEAFWLTAANLPTDTMLLADMLNSLEGMLVGIHADATFIAPSNPFGDYVLAPADTGDEGRSVNGGVVVDPANPERWFPSFRIIDYAVAPQVNVGARLRQPITGPLNYRGGSYQIAVQGPIQVAPADVAVARTTLRPDGAAVTVMTLNGFNLDVRIEDPALAQDPRRDVDDDVGDGRFRSLARAVVEQARGPDIIALQEIQDNDGAEISTVVDATQTYEELIDEIRRRQGPTYAWVDIAPHVDADGGQPGGNIRNGFLYNPARVTLADDSVVLLGKDDAAYEGSRKPLAARFVVRASGAMLTVVNVHLASKRHQHSIFAPRHPGFDPKLATRMRQAEIVRALLIELAGRNQDYYVTGDFNDFEFSDTLAAMAGDESINLVLSLPPNERYDYNHRGKLEALMHGLVSRRQVEQGRAEYAILHGNELIGVKAGDLGSKPTDHAYVIARLQADSSE